MYVRIKVNNLLSCPFCGTEVELHRDEEGGVFYFHIMCLSCFGKGNTVEAWGDTADEAIESWNQRSNQLCSSCDERVTPEEILEAINITRFEKLENPSCNAGRK